MPDDQDKTPKLPSSFLVEVAIAGMCVFALALTIGLVTGAETGSMADWVAGISTFAAFVAAVLAGKFAYDALKVEQERDRFRDQQLLRSQAELVAAWMAPLVGITTYQNGKTRLLLSAGQKVHVRNASQLPVTAVRLTFEKTATWATGEGSRTHTYELGQQDLGIVPPDYGVDPISVDSGIVQKLAKAYEDPDVPEEATRSVRVEVAFVDAGDRGWIREPDGRLQRQPDVLVKMRKAGLL